MLIYFNDIYKKITYAPNPILKLDENEILQAIKENHNDTVGHLRIQKTYQRIKDKFKISGLLERVENFVKTYDTCQKEKLSRIRPKESPYYITFIDNVKKKIHGNRLKTYFFQDNADPSTSNNTFS